MRCASTSYCVSVDDNGRIIARVTNPAMNSALLQEVYQWNKEGATIDDVIERLRLRTVPSEYVGTIHTWIDGMAMVKLTMFTVSCIQARMKLESRSYVLFWHSWIIVIK